MHKSAKFIGAAVVFLIISISAWLFLKPAEKIKVHAKPTLVTIEKVKQVNVPILVTAVGQVIAPNTTLLSAKQAGAVTRIDFHSGEVVKKGQLLLQIDDTTEQANYAQQQANYHNLKSQYGRIKNLAVADKDTVSQEQIVQTSSAMRVAKAQLQAAEKQLQNTKVVAPFDGIVGIPQPLLNHLAISGQEINQSVQLTQGTYLQMGDPIAIISNPKKVFVQYQVSQQYSADLNLGQTVTLTTSAYPGEKFTGTVTYISPIVLDTAQAFNVRAKINNPELLLRSGMNASVTQEVVANRKVLAVPGLSLVPSLSGYNVYMIQDSKVKAVPVTIGERFKKLVAIHSGLKAGDEIISEGIEKITPGMLVKIKQ